MPRTGSDGKWRWRCTPTDFDVRSFPNRTLRFCQTLTIPQTIRRKSRILQWKLYSPKVWQLLVATVAVLRFVLQRLQFLRFPLSNSTARSALRIICFQRIPSKQQARIPISQDILQLQLRWEGDLDNAPVPPHRKRIQGVGLGNDIRSNRGKVQESTLQSAPVLETSTPTSQRSMHKRTYSSSQHPHTSDTTPKGNSLQYARMRRRNLPS